VALVGDAQTINVVKRGDATCTDACLFPQFCAITENHIHEVGLTGKGSAGVFQSIAKSNVFSRNVAYNGPRAGIENNDGFGGNFTQTGNLLFEFSRETGGHSAWNAWDRTPYLTTDPSGEATATPAWNHLGNNIIISHNFAPCPPDGSGTICHTPNAGERTMLLRLMLPVPTSLRAQIGASTSMTARAFTT